MPTFFWMERTVSQVDLRGLRARRRPGPVPGREAEMFDAAAFHEGQGLEGFGGGA